MSSLQHKSRSYFLTWLRIWNNSKVGKFPKCDAAKPLKSITLLSCINHPDSSKWGMTNGLLSLFNSCASSLKISGASVRNFHHGFDVAAHVGWSNRNFPVLILVGVIEKNVLPCCGQVPIEQPHCVRRSNSDLG